MSLAAGARPTSMLRWLASVLTPAAAVLYLLSAPVLGAPPDEEDYRNTVLSSLLHARTVFDGGYVFWTSDLGFGLPLPLHPALLLHPLTPFLGVMTPETLMRTFYAFHGVLGAAGCWWLMRHLGTRAPLAGIAATTWALSSPALQYSVTDLWMSYFLGWSLFPLLVVLTLRVLGMSDARQSWPDAIALGCVAGLMVANGQAGQMSVLFLVLAVIVLVEVRRMRRVLPALTLAAVIGVVLAAPSMVPLLQELDRFPDLPRLAVDSGLGWQSFVDAPLRPFLSVSPSEWLPAVAERGTRVPFFGGPLLLAAVAAVAGLARPLPHAAAFVTAFLISGVAMALPDSARLDAMSGAFVFRDPFVLFGIVLGTMMMQRWAVARPGLVAVTAALQVLVLLLAASPFVSEARTSGRQVERTFLDHSGMTMALRDWVPRLSGRWYLAPELDDMVRRGMFEEDGLAPEAWYYRGLPIVNGTFKGISVDAFYPSGTLPIGRIRGEAVTVASVPTLSVLGISAVLAAESEPVSAALQEVARFETSQGPIRLLRNPAAWPGAAFVDERVLAVSPPLLTDCEHGGILCRDFSAVAAAGPTAPVAVTRTEGQIELQFDAHPTARWIVVSEMHRPQWIATGDGRRLRVEAAWDALMAVEVPPDVSVVTLDFRPTVVLASIWTAVGTLVASAAALAWFARPGSSSRGTSVALLGKRPTVSSRR